MIAIIDYDAGNIRSVEKAMDKLGAEYILTRDPDTIKSADGVILPGVGAFGDAMEKLDSYGLRNVLTDYASSNKPFLGICLGMQVLFESSEEAPGVKGLSILPGNILRIKDEPGLKIPHMGWNSLIFHGEKGKLFANTADDSYVYFVHSYYLKAKDESIVKASAQYGSTTIHASVEKNNVFGCQFHPEKSSRVGLGILSEFIKIVRG